MKLLLFVALLMFTLFVGCDKTDKEVAEIKHGINLRDSNVRLILLEEMYWKTEKISWGTRADKIAIQSNLLGLIFQEVTFGDEPLFIEEERR